MLEIGAAGLEMVRGASALCMHGGNKEKELGPMVYVNRDSIEKRETRRGLCQPSVFPVLQSLPRGTLAR